MPVPRFSPEINFGHILTVLTLMGGIFGAWSTLDSRVSAAEIRIETANDFNRQIVAQLAEQTRVISLLREQVAALNATIEAERGR